MYNPVNLLVPWEWEKVTAETEEIKLYVNPMEPENKSPLLWDKLVEEMAQEGNVLIQTPYIICSRDLHL